MKKEKFLWLILLLSLSFFSFKSLMRPGYFPMHDDMQPVRLLQLDKCLKDFQIPCRWVPDLGYGYGYPLFVYYSPLAYYLMEVFHLLGFSFLASIKIEFILTFILSGLGMFLFAQSLWGNFGGLISALFYVYAPYRAADVYTRGAVGEFTAFIFLPLILWAILEFIRQNKKKYLLFLSLSSAGLLLSHNITSLIFAPVAVFWAIFLLWHYRKSRLFSQFTFAAFLSFALAGFFILPVLLEKKFAHVETMTYGYFNYLAHFVSLKQLFLSTHWGFGSSELGPHDDLSFAIGFLHWFFALLALLAGFHQRKKEKLKSNLLFLLGIIGLTAAFMTHQRSVFIWNRITFLKYLQFPWRFLTLITFAFSAMTGGLVFFLRKYRLPVGILMILLLILLNAFYFNPSKWLEISDEDKFSGQLWEDQITASIFDYLPIFAKSPPAQKAPDQPWTIEGQIEVVNFEKGTDWQKGKIKVVTDIAKIQLPLFYFPRFELQIDQQITPFNYENDLGLITFAASRGEHDFYVKLRKTPVRIAGDLLTLISFLIIIRWAFYERKNP